MNPGPVEEAGKVAGGFIDAMRTQPLALALAVMNIMLMALFFYVAQWAGSNRSTEFNALLEANKEVQRLLYNCVPAPKAELQLRSFPFPRPRPQEAPDGNDDRPVQQRTDQPHSDDSSQQ